MKSLFLLLCFPVMIWSQKTPLSSDVDLQYLTDSVHIENIIEFYESYEFRMKKTPAVRFKIKITNLGSKPIPNLTRVTNRTKYLKLMYNGEDALDMNLGNGMEGNDWPWYITSGESDEFFTAFILTDDAGIFKYDQPMNVTWIYMGVSSTTEIVDITSLKVY